MQSHLSNKEKQSIDCQINAQFTSIIRFYDYSVIRKSDGSITEVECENIKYGVVEDEKVYVNDLKIYIPFEYGGLYTWHKYIHLFEYIKWQYLHKKVFNKSVGSLIRDFSFNHENFTISGKTQLLVVSSIRIKTAHNIDMRTKVKTNECGDLNTINIIINSIDDDELIPSDPFVDLKEYINSLKLAIDIKEEPESIKFTYNSTRICFIYDRGIGIVFNNPNRVCRFDAQTIIKKFLTRFADMAISVELSTKITHIHYQICQLLENKQDALKKHYKLIKDREEYLKSINDQIEETEKNIEKFEIASQEYEKEENILALAFDSIQQKNDESKSSLEGIHKVQ